MENKKISGTIDYEVCGKKIAENLEENFDLNSCSLPDEYNYTCLPLCLLDAVFSIGAHYKATSNVVRRYCEKGGIEMYRTSNSAKSEAHTISDLIAVIQSVGVDKFAAEYVNNSQRTSSQNGVLKAEAVLECAKALQSFNIETKADFNAKYDEVESAYNNVKGQSSGISFSYLKMLCGDEDTVKPDRHILSYLNGILPCKVEIDDAQLLIEKAFGILAPNYPELTIRKIDYLIWAFKSNS